jgi:hypothetical protein
MEELFVIVVGAGALVLMPLVPALRPAVKSIVKGGMAFMNATRMATATAGEHWRSLVQEAEDELKSEHEGSESIPEAAKEAAVPALEG